MGMRLWRRRSASAAAAVLVAASALCAQVPEPGANSALANHRIIKFFDFTEPENHESVPMYWRKVTGKGFPHYATGAFDYQRGHDSPPSFYLDSNGGNVAYRYYARGIPAQEGSDYQIRAWIKPHRLIGARAYVSAYFMNRMGERIEGTERVSHAVGGPDSNDRWQELSFMLPGDVEDAHLIAIAAYVVQANVWQQEPPGPRAIVTSDIEGGAWFDDLAVLRLPRIRLQCQAPGAVFAHDEVPTLVAEVRDSDGQGLQAELVVRDAAGLEKWRDRLEVRLPGAPPTRSLILPDLGPGLYTATLHIRVHDIEVRTPYVRFARLGPDLSRGRGVQRGFGLLVDNEAEELWPQIICLTDLLGVWQVKVSMWAEGRPADWMEEERAGQASYLAHLYRKNGMAVGTLGGVPLELRDPNLPYRRSLLDLFTEAPNNLGRFLKYALARYAPFVDYWQIGSDGDRALIWDRRLGQTVARLNESFKELISMPQLAAPWSLQQAIGEAQVPAAAISLFVPQQVPAEGLAANFASFEDLPYKQHWLTVESRDLKDYQREAVLCDFMKRMISAKATGADIVFTEQPWCSRRVVGRPILEPDERFLLLRTLVYTLSNTSPVTSLQIGRSVRGHLFSRGGRGVLALWDDEAPPEGTTLQIHLGGEPVRLSAWGEVSPVPLEGDGHVLNVTRMPVIFDGVSKRLMMLRGAVRLNPPFMESSLTLHETTFEMTNPYREPVSGRIRLDVPARWDVSPTHFEFSLPPGETFRQLLNIRFPQVETAGNKPVMAHLMLDAGEEYELRIPLQIEVGLRDLGVTALAQRVGNKVVVRQRVTNFSSVPVNYRSFLVAPGRVRQTRLISNLHPGQTVLKEYDFDDAADLIGRSVRIGLREVDGPLIHNEVIEIP
ncbi:MAG: hypothetical protein JSU68_05615 [Phycisphaerales bacterium]|nr:MAG: hypothetical protein JSU68_05615 [Phycisphaerales bacterium]